MKMWKEDFNLDIPLSVAQFSKEAAEYEYTIIDKEKDMDKYLENLLKRLRDKGIPMVVASSSTRFRAKKILDILEISDYFKDVVSCEDVENHEPATDAVILASEILNLKPNQCIVIEDSAHGIKAAKKAGCRTIGYAFYSDEQVESLSKAGADLVITSFKDLDINKLFDFMYQN